jgi:hypothetical protein
LQGVPVKRLVTIVGISLLLTACGLAEPPFVYQDSVISNDKKKGEIYTLGLVWVCYHDPDLEQARALALQTCKEYGLSGYEKLVEKFQCKLSAPNRVVFRCYDPQMRLSNGKWVNTLNKQEVKRWRTEQSNLTGKPLSEIYAGPLRDVPDAEESVGREDTETQMDVGN